MNQKIYDGIASEMANIFALAKDSLDPKANLFELGLDSLMMLKLGQRLEGMYGVTVEMGFFFRELTSLEKIVDYIEQNGIQPQTATPAPQPIPLPTQPTAPAVTANHSTITTVNPDSGLAGLFVQQIQTMQALFRQQLQMLSPDASAIPVSAQPSQINAAAVQAAAPTTIPAKASTENHAPVLTAEEQETIRSIQRNVRGLKLEADSLTEEQTVFVNDLVKRHVQRTHTSRDMMRRSRKNLADWKSTLSFRFSMKEAAYPIISSASKGSHFTDVDGNSYIDIALGMGVHFLGHGMPEMTRAVEQQISQGYELGPQCDLTGKAAEGICRLTGNERTAFSNTGSESVMMALRIARAHTGRKKIAMFSGSYHGIFDGVIAMNHGEEHTIALSPGTPQGMVEDMVIFDYGTDESLQRIEALAKRGELAAVLVEPVQSRRPSLQPQTFLRKLRQITEDTDTILIFDEMVTGFRIAPGGCQEHFGIRADMALYGKIIGGGMPVGVVCGKSKCMDHIDGGAWNYGDGSVPEAEMIVFGGTFCRHPLAMASVCAVVDLLESHPEWYPLMNRRTEQFADSLNAWFEQEEVPLRISYFASQFKFDSFGSYSPLLQPIELDLLYMLLLEHGVYTWERRTCFFSVQHTDDDIAAVADAIRKSVMALRKGGFEFKGGGPAFFRQLTSVERRLMAEMQRSGDQRAYHMPGAWTTESKLDANRLEIALGEVIRRHDALRTSYRIVNGEYTAITVEEPKISLERIEADGREQQQIIQDFMKPFDLAHGPLFRAGFVETEKDCLLMLDGLHLVLDGISLATLSQDLQLAYEGQTLAPPPPTYADYAGTMKEFSGSEQENRLRQEWHAVLEEASAADVPFDFALSETQPASAGHIRIDVDKKTTTTLRASAKDCGVSLFMMLAAGYAILLKNLSGQDDITIGTVAAGRPGERFDKTVGMFVNTIILRMKVQPEQTIRQFLTTVREACVFAYANQELPFETLAEDGYGHLVQTMITYENADERELKLAGSVLQPVSAPIPGSMFAISLDTIETGGVIHLDFEYDPCRLKQTTVERWANWFCRILSAFSQDPSAPVSATRPFTQEETDAVLAFAKGSESSVQQTGLYARFTEQVKAAPDKTAVVAEDGSLSYRQLEDAAARIAHALTQDADIRGKAIGICMERSVWFAAAVLGVLRAGGYYVPLATDIPEERAKLILTDTQAYAVVTQSSLRASCSSWETPLILADALPDTPQELQKLVDACPKDLAYILFTSGSTGTPKGVMITQQSVMNLVQWLADDIYQPLGETVREAMLAHFVFDVSVQHLFGSLLNGHTLHILPEHMAADGYSLREYLKKNTIDLLDMTPSQFQILTERGRYPVFPSIRHLNFGAETLHAEIVRQFYSHEANTGVRVCNMYGPTETCVQSTWHDVDLVNDATGNAIPIGKPILNTTAYVLDHDQTLQAVGLYGQLYIGGAGLSQGYLNLQQQTEDAFVESPYGRLYNTGDRARWTEEGELVFAGRKDSQIKILGHRIEPEEIEQVAKTFPGIEHAAVMVLHEGDSVTLTLFHSPVVDTAAIRTHLEQRLPSYMVPRRIAGLEKLPLTVSGKIDRRALGEIRLSSGKRSAVAQKPLTPTEETLAGIWKNILKCETVNPEDHFLELGGDSIKALQIVARMTEAGYPIRMNDLFRLGTLSELAKHVNSSSRAEIVQRKPYQGIAALSPMQAWFFQTHTQNLHHYNHALLFETPSLSAQTVRLATESLWKRHDALRATFTNVDAEVTQTIQPTTIPDNLFTVVDLAGDPNATAQITRITSEQQAAFRLDQAPLFRITLFKTGGRDRVFFLAHHLVVDGVSWHLLLEDFRAAYELISSGSAAQVTPSIDSFADWTQAASESATEQSMEYAAKFWLETLDGLQPAFTSTENSSDIKPQSKTIEVHCTDISLHDLNTKPLAACNATAADAALTALRKALNKTAPQASGVLIEGHGRQAVGPVDEPAQAVGWFTSIWPVRFDAIDETSGLLDLLIQTKEASRTASRRGTDYAMIRYLSDLPQAEKLRATQEPDIVFNYLADLSGKDTFFVPSHEPTGASSTAGPQAASMELDLFFQNGTFTLQANIRTDKVTEQQARDILNETIRTLRDLIQTCGQQTETILTASDLTTQPLTQADFEAVCSRYQYRPEEIEDAYPLTPVQEGMLFHTRREPESPAYFEQLWFDLEGELDTESFRRAWQTVVQRHPVLRTVFVDSPDGSPLQVVLKQLPPLFELIGKNDIQSNNPQRLFDELCEKDRQMPFDLEHGPLLRCKLVQVDGNRWRFLNSYPHLIADGWCIGIMLEEVGQLYRQYTGIAPAVLAEPVPYSRFIQAAREADDKSSASAVTWEDYLDGLVEVTGIAPTRAGTGRQMNEYAFNLDNDLREGLEQTAREWNVTPSVVFQTAWSALLSRHAETDDTVFGLVCSGRDLPLDGIESIMGLCIQTLPIRARMDKIKSPKELAAQLQHDRIGLEKRAQISAMPAGTWFNHILVFENYPLDDSVLQPFTDTGLKVSQPGGHEEVEYELSIEVHPSQNFAITVHYNESRYDGAFIRQIGQQLVHVLRTLTRTPDTLLSDLELQPQSEVAAAETHSDSHLQEDGQTVMDLFMKKVSENPQAPCVQFGGNCFSRKEIADRAMNVAAVLHQAGVQTGTPVCMQLPRCEEVVPVILGIWLSGGIYLPLWPDAPTAQLKSILEELDNPVLITAQDTNEIAALVSVIFPPDKLLQPADQMEKLSEVKLYDAAYMIYTSGSTGKPKGVIVGHQSLRNLGIWIAETMYNELSTPVRETWIPPIPFDASLHSLLGALLHGHLLLVPDEETRNDPSLLSAFMHNHNSTVANMTPTYFSALLDEVDGGVWSGDLVVLGAESVPASLIERFYENPAHQDKILCNLYGPTEACVEVACYWMHQNDWDRNLPIPVGEPVRHTGFNLIDRFGHAAATGVPGELLISGECLAAGYNQRPEETDRAFTASPLAQMDGKRVYRSGDKMRRVADGSYTYLGRMDRQLKIRGHRIEPDQVENAINLYPGIDGSAVIGVTVSGRAVADAQRMVAFVRAKECDLDALRVYLRGQLAHYMIPDDLICMDRFPLTANNKLDMKKLTQIYLERKPQENADQNSVLVPENDTEKYLAEIWQEILSAWPASRAQSFFDAGGNSLAAMRFAGRIRSRLGFDIKLRALYESSSFGQIAELIATNQDDFEQKEKQDASVSDSTEKNDLHESGTDEEMTDDEKELLNML